MKSLLIGKDSDAGKDWRKEEKGMTEDEMVGWHHQLNGHEFEQTPGDSEGQGSLVCCSPWGCKEPDTTEWLNKNNNARLRSCGREEQSRWTGCSARAVRAGLLRGWIWDESCTRKRRQLHRPGRRVFQAEGRAGAKALRQGHTWCIWGTKGSLWAWSGDWGLPGRQRPHVQSLMGPTGELGYCSQICKETPGESSWREEMGGSWC